ncbi:thiopeptide-type bacteriocin biosynthesis protein [Pedobacter sp. Du54]|uniref:lantibiotic dehydratase n=1 Tax=Pedobacter anseongensis TaxID=3133439 RepID=UPI0030A1AB12
MKNMKPFERLICRTPAFGTNQTLEELLKKLLDKIEESSTEFHKLVQGVKPEDLAHLDEKTWFTLWKYFNRAKYRATPFGSFAAISTLPLTYHPTPEITLSQTLQQHQFIDWSQKDNLELRSAEKATAFLTNSSLYFTAKQIRYLKCEGNQFELSAVNAQPILNLVLLTCKRKTSPQVLFQLLEKTFNMDPVDAKKLLAQLVDLQLLITDRHPNITGEDYFTRLQLPVSKKPSNYILSERRIESGNFEGKLLKDFPALIAFFASQLGSPTPPDLVEFIHAFSRRFESQEIPLTRIMDPEIGIGYGGLAQPRHADPLIGHILKLGGQADQENLSYGKLQQFLLNGILKRSPIELSEFTYNPLEKNQLPNTLSFLFHRYKDRVVLSYGGGCTASSLLGRFTHCGGEIETLAREIVDLETAANPGVIFFEVGYQSEKKVDNVNRRQLLYSAELPILSWSQHAQPLDMEDILVTVEGGQVILKSKSLGKRLIPRIASSYNHSRSDLSVYRFLCDVQSQGLITRLSLNLQQYFPGLDHYPRVEFRDIIVSPAQWKIPTQALTTKQSLSAWLADSKIDFVFKVGETDQSLTIDPHRAEDLKGLLGYGKQQPEAFYLTEALLDNSTLLKDEHKNQYTGEYIANFYHKASVYVPNPPRHSSPTEVYLPGSKWLYVEIYVHPSSANALLIKLIWPFLTTHSALIKNWFFIRYTDPSAHIRLRLYLKDPVKGLSLLNDLQMLLHPLAKQGLISDIKLPSYRPELLRYGSTRMALVEAFFRQDSRYVLQLLKKQPTIDQLIASGLHAVMELCRYCFQNQPLQLPFIQRYAQRFAAEMQLDTATFKKINASFQQLQGNLEQLALTPTAGIRRKWKEAFEAVVANCETERTKENLLADLIHMHVNRLFTGHQRIYETIIYQYLSQLLLRRAALAKAAGEFRSSA